MSHQDKTASHCNCCHKHTTANHAKLLTQATIAGVFGILLMILELTQILPNLISVVGKTIWLIISIFTLGIMLYAGKDIYQSAINTIIKFHPSMDTLIAIGTSAAWIYSFIIILMPQIIPNQQPRVFFAAGVVILAFINFGRALEQRARGKTGEAIKRLIGLQAKTATVIREQKEYEIDIKDVVIGDSIKVHPGEKIAVDGEIIQGRSTIDEAMLTGEAFAVSKSIGDKVIAGTINKTGSFIFRTKHVGAKTVLAQIINLVQNAQKTKPSIAQLADNVAAVFVPSVILIAVLTSLIWLAFGPAPQANFMLITAMSVLVISCPCALGLAAPISVVASVGRAAEFGMLIRNGDALQMASKIKTIVFDKTGTITRGDPEITNIIAINNNEKHLLEITASAENLSEHPLREAFIIKAKEQNIALQQVEEFQSITGQGITATVNKKLVLIGNRQLMTNNGIVTTELEEKAQALTQLAQTVIYVAENNELLGIVAIADTIKAEAKSVINNLKKNGFRCIMVTGDNKKTATAIAKQVGISEVFSELKPQDKFKVIQDLQKKKLKVGMVGDGINDAPALAQADVGFALGAGTDIAIESADITLIGSSLSKVYDAILLSKTTMRNIKQNLFGAFIYNILGIPIAAGVLYPMMHLLLNPMIASAAMAMSSVTVVVNANRLRRVKIKN